MLNLQKMERRIKTIQMEAFLSSSVFAPTKESMQCRIDYMQERKETLEKNNGELKREILALCEEFGVRPEVICWKKGRMVSKTVQVDLDLEDETREAKATLQALQLKLQHLEESILCEQDLICELRTDHVRKLKVLATEKDLLQQKIAAVEKKRHSLQKDGCDILED